VIPRRKKKEEEEKKKKKKKKNENYFHFSFAILSYSLRGRLLLGTSAGSLS